MTTLQNPDMPVNAPHGTREAVFEFIDEMAALAGIQAEMIRLACEQGDETLAVYGARRLRAYTQMIGKTLNQLADHGPALERGE
jgi:hypothetical protein